MNEDTQADFEETNGAGNRAQNLLEDDSDDDLSWYNGRLERFQLA